MAADEKSSPSQPVSPTTELVAYTKQELAADAERQAQLQAASTGELPTESHSGATLDLSHRSIRLLPVEIIALIKDRVERLALSHNPQITFPSEIVQCERLRYLNIRWNQLKTFPPEILGLKNLEILDLSKNRITEIPEDIKMMTSLKFLAVARNRITRLPLALGEMTKLQKMIFDENPIVFPPLDAIQPDPSVGPVDRERDVCQQVKRFMRLELMRDKLRTKSEDNLSDTAQETPRASIRFTGGRFPIRPSNGGLERFTETKTSSPDEAAVPVVSQRSVRDPSIVPSTVTAKRLSIAPVVPVEPDGTRNRSETASSTASLRSRRQGYVPSRRPTGDLEYVRDTPEPDVNQYRTMTKSHWHQVKASQDSTWSHNANGGDYFSNTNSPAQDILHRSAYSRSIANARRPSVVNSPELGMERVGYRLIKIFENLNLPFREAFNPAMPDAPAHSRNARLINASNHVRTLGQHLEQARRGPHPDMGEPLPPLDQGVIEYGTKAMKQYATLVKDLKANARTMSGGADPIYIRALMFQLHTATIELRNICNLLGFKSRHGVAKEGARTPQNWGPRPRTTTPTQSSRMSTKRMKGANILRTMANDSSLRIVAPTLPISTSSSRTNTMVSSTPLTARSGDSFSSFSSRAPSLSRSNTLHSNADDSDTDQQFEKVYGALKHAGEIAAFTLPALLAEIRERQDKAQREGQSIAARDWDRALTLYEATMTHDSALLLRLKVVKMNDPGVRYQSDFWQLCDKFVQSWTELVSHLRALTTRRVDIGHIKALMRNVQKAMKEVTLQVSQYPPYQHFHHSQRNGSDLPPLPPLSTNLSYSGLSVSTMSATPTLSSTGYVTPVPATPLSAALGPAVQAMVTNPPSAGPSSTLGPRDHYPPPPATARMVHERVDTVMLPPTGQAKRP